MFDLIQNDPRILGFFFGLFLGVFLFVFFGFFAFFTFNTTARCYINSSVQFSYLSSSVVCPCEVPIYYPVPEKKNSVG